jgi:hypothetical protein
MQHSGLRFIKGALAVVYLKEAAMDPDSIEVK